MTEQRLSSLEKRRTELRVLVARRGAEQTLMKQMCPSRAADLRMFGGSESHSKMQSFQDAAVTMVGWTGLCQVDVWASK